MDRRIKLIFTGALFVLSYFLLSQFAFWNNRIGDMIFLSAIPAIIFLLAAHNKPDRGKNIFQKSFSLTSAEIKFAGIIIIALFALRYLTRDLLAPTTDELLHLFEAKRRILGSAINYLTEPYSRFDILTQLLTLTFKTVSISVANGRIWGVLFYGILPFGLWFKLKKHNPTVALLSALLLALSPWFLMVSTVIREYIFLIGAHLFVGLSVFESVEAIVKRTYSIKRFLIDLLILGTVVVYSVKFDPLSTTSGLFINYIIGGVYFVLVFPWRKVNKRLLFGIGGALLLLAFCSFKIFSAFTGLSLQNWVDTAVSFNIGWIRQIFFNGSQDPLIFSSFFIFLGLVGASFKYFTGHKNGLDTFVSVSVLVILYIFTFHFNRYVRPRYITMIIPWLSILFAYSVIYCRNFIDWAFKKKTSLIVLILLFTNWYSIYIALFWNKPGFEPITVEFHEDLSPVAQLVCNKFEKKYVIASPLPQGMAFYCDDPNASIILYQAKTKKPQVTLQRILGEYQRGFLVIDDRRVRLLEKYISDEGIKFEEFSLPYYDRVGVYTVYLWEKK